MRIIIDGRMYRESGVGRYIRNLLQQLAKLDQENDYFILLLKKDRGEVKLPENFHEVTANFRWYSVKEQLELPGLLSDLKPDLVHFPHFNVPIFYRGKFVVTIHDLIHQKVQMHRATTRDPLTYRVKQWGYRTALKTGLKQSQKIITVSDFVKSELEELWGVNSSKIVVTKEAVEESLVSQAKKMTTKKSTQVLDKFKIQKPYLFYVGNAHPHKNVEGLIKAFLKLRQNYQYLTLVLAGHDHYFWDRVKSENSLANIVFTGFVTDQEMVALYQNAQAFVMPSFEEGFGIPLLEAMACGCPVVSSSAASLPEVGGDAAIYFDPRNQGEMVDKIQEVLNNQKLRKSLIAKGEKRYQKFSWKKLAEETLKIYSS